MALEPGLDFQYPAWIFFMQYIQTFSGIESGCLRFLEFQHLDSKVHLFALSLSPMHTFLHDLLMTDRNVVIAGKWFSLSAFLVC